MKIKSTKEKIVCDSCFLENVEKEATRTCKFCKNDFCGQHSFEIMKMKRIKRYNYKKTVKCYVCDTCVNILSLKVKR